MSKVEAIQAKLAENDLDAVILRNPKNRFYATGFISSEGTVLITRTACYYFVDSRYYEVACANAGSKYFVSLFLTAAELGEQIKKAVNDFAIKRLGFEDEFITYSSYSAIQETVGDCELVGASQMIDRLREVKTEEELGYIKEAQKITDKVFLELLNIIKPGITEIEIASEITYRQMKYGGMKNAFDPIVVTGTNSSMPHGVPSSTAVKEGDFITMDFGTIYNNYCSDMTRTVAVGHATDSMIEVYETVAKAQLAGIEFARANVPGRAIDRAAREVIEKAGYGQYFQHGFGHGLGIDVHETPRASSTENRIMPEGAVISAEPGIYIPGQFGVRIEDLLYLKVDCNENLTASPKNLIIL